MVNWYWKEKMGKLTFEGSDGKKFRVNIYSGNCLAVFIFEYKDENKKDMYQFFGFWNDVKHCARIKKNNGTLFYNKLVKAELNYSYKECQTIAKLLVDEGCKVTIFKKERKAKKTSNK